MVDRLLGWTRAITAAARYLRRLPGLAWTWLSSHASRCLAVAWLSGLVVFGGVTVRRARAMQRADDEAALANGTGATRVEAHKAARPEVVEMLDVDEINQRRIDRFHALGLAAPGESEDPDDETIAAARASTSTVRIPEGQVAGTSGDVVVVTKDGIKGWLKRNKGKKADPETLAWLRQEEAAEGRQAYAGWADRDDADILAWSKDRRRTGATTGSADNDHAAVAAALDGIAAPARPGEAKPRTIDTPTDNAELPTATSPTGSLTAPREPTPAESAMTKPELPPASGSGAALGPAPTHAAAAPGFRVARLGKAAVRALQQADIPTEPTTAELAPIRAQLEGSNSSLAMIARDRPAVVLLRGDVVFHDAALTREGKQLVRELARMFDAMHGRSFRVIADPDRAMELASTIVMAGLDPDRLEISFRDSIDPALDLVEIEILSSLMAPLREAPAPR